VVEAGAAAGEGVETPGGNRRSLCRSHNDPYGDKYGLTDLANVPVKPPVDFENHATDLEAPPEI
jgi:hypothetical protein